MPLLALQGGRTDSLYGVRVRADLGASQKWLRWSAHPLDDVECRGQAQYPAFAPGSSEVALGFLVSVYLVHNLPQLRMHTFIFSPLQFLCILSPEETSVHVQAQQQTVSGPKSLLILTVTTWVPLAWDAHDYPGALGTKFLA